MDVTVRKFGVTSTGETVNCFKVTNKNGMSVELLEFGATIRSIILPTKEGPPVDVAFGYDTVEDYETKGGFIGCVVGRYGSRIRKGELCLNGKTYHLHCNDSGNHLHGGKTGLGKRVWKGSEQNGQVTFSYFSPDEEEGYPGNVKIAVTYTLTDDDELVLDYMATTDADTVLNLTNHCYFNLNGHKHGSILNHKLQLNSYFYTPGDKNLVPTGEIRSVKGTPLDFTEPKEIGRDIETDFDQLHAGTGYDLNYVVNQAQKGLSLVARVWGENGVEMTCYSSCPGVQFYSGNFLEGQVGKEGAVYHRRSGLCLETQFFPNSVEYSHFPSPIVHAGQTQRHSTVYAFSVK